MQLIDSLLRSYVEWISGGAMSSGIARMRLIDDWIKEAAARGIRQSVLIGAGYDSRASYMTKHKVVTQFRLKAICLNLLKDMNSMTLQECLSRIKEKYVKN
jgi:hypothetical protein